ncbi:efflux RND transporter periplasmic adaptor subunit [Brevundimonas sp.]|jgi:HlyD family secretion protein|uniref:efflux RND transporter periplasmic adaptor subunit n=1 Tax=Brevundimonas sp. TaxID=1871086 RepID=UPI0037C151DF
MKNTWILAGLGLLGACADKGGESTPVRPDPAPVVTASTVTLRTIAREVTVSGVLIAREEAAVGAELSGYRVLRVLAEEGDYVRRGQALAVLDPGLLNEELAQAEVAAERAAAEYRRVAGLTGTGVIAEEVIEQRGFDARTAAARLRDLQARRGRLTLRAPVSGRVLARSLRPGDVSGAAGESFRLARDGVMELQAELPEAEFGRIRVGASVPVRLSSGEALTGTVRLLSPLVDPLTKLGRVRILLPAHPALRVGGFATAVMDAHGDPAPAVPERAVQYRAGGPTVTVISTENRVSRVDVRPGARGGGYVEIIGGPPVGTRVLSGGDALVLPGDVVRIAPESGQ